MTIFFGILLANAESQRQEKRYKGQRGRIWLSEGPFGSHLCYPPLWVPLSNTSHSPWAYMRPVSVCLPC